MNWRQRQACQRFLGSALWLIPVAAMLAALLAAAVSRWVSNQVRWKLLDFGPEGARALTGVLASSLLTFIVFVISSLLLAVQIAGGQLSPRVTARVFENRITQLSIGAFVFAWVFALAAAGRVENRVPQLSVELAILFSLISVGLFLALAQRVAYSLRPGTILTTVANDTRAVIETLYPQSFSQNEIERGRIDLQRSGSARTIEYSGRPGVIIGFDTKGLIDLATRSRCALEIVPAIGDFVATGAELFRVHGDGAAALGEESLYGSIAFGPERSLQQDPAFGFRIIVDIANKALSPAINDPTTAVLAIDQLQHLLQLLGRRRLDTGVWRDPAGQLRLVYRTPDWDDYVTLAVTEIRLYAGLSAQVTRRLQAMFDGLLLSVPAARTAILREQMSQLRQTVERTFGDPQDGALATCPDLQGFGSTQQAETGEAAGGQRPAGLGP